MKKEHAAIIKRESLYSEEKQIALLICKARGSSLSLKEIIELISVSKVYTRNERGIRGHVEAYVAAFDKHWNLALEDCFEVWSRKIHRKAPALGTRNYSTCH